MRGKLRQVVANWRSRRELPAPAAGRDLLYRDYRLFVVAQGAAWRVIIHAPGSPFACAAAPAGDGAATRGEAIAAARRIIDRLIAASGPA